MFGQQRDGQGLQLGHHPRLHVRRGGDHRGHHSGHLHQYDHGGRDDRFRILLALRLRRRGQLVRGGRSRPDRLQPSGRLHGHPHGMGRRRQPRHDDQNDHRPCGQRAADGRLQLLAPDDQHRHDRDLYGQIDRFRRRNRIARMALPRRHDLDGHQRDLHVRTNGHVQRPADRDRRPAAARTAPPRPSTSAQATSTPSRCSGPLR